MSTSVDVDSDLVRAVMARHPGASMREAVELAIDAYLSRDAARRIKTLRGRIRIEDACHDLRSIDRHT